MTTHTKLTPTHPPVTAQKPGWKTSEFWVNALAILGIAAAAVAGNLNSHVATYAIAASGAAYAFSRGLAKLFPPKPS